MKFFENWQRKKLEHQKKLIQQADDGYIVSLSTGQYKAKDLEEVSAFMCQVISGIEISVSFLFLYICLWGTFVLFSIKFLSAGLEIFMNSDAVLVMILIFPCGTTIFILNYFIKKHRMKLKDFEYKQPYLNNNSSKNIILSFCNFILYIGSIIICLCLPAIFLTNDLYKPAIKTSTLYLKIKHNSIKNYEIRGLSKVFLKDIEGAKEDFTLGYNYSKKDKDKEYFSYLLFLSNLHLGNQKEAYENLEEYKKISDNNVSQNKKNEFYEAGNILLDKKYVFKIININDNSKEVSFDWSKIKEQKNVCEQCAMINRPYSFKYKNIIYLF